MDMNKIDKAEIEAVIKKTDATVGAVATRIPAAKAAFERLGIDYCCGGNCKLKAELQEKGITEEQLIEAIGQTVAAQPSPSSKGWSTASISELIDHILATHHVFMKRELPRIDGLLAKVAGAHGERHGRMLGQLTTTFQGMHDEILQHLAKEEEILFPLIAATDTFMSGEGQRPTCHCGTVLNPIRKMEHEHENAGQALARMRELTADFGLPDDACPTFATLYEALEAMEKDLHEHIHLENNILFPSAAEQEAAMTGA
jgi:regulator of cell morphogenesis and NO signaling